MGGIATDDHGRSSVAGLWAVGEVASTGLHGANRLASNSLLEAVVLGARVAADIKSLVPQDRAGHFVEPKKVAGPRRADDQVQSRLIAQLRAVMTLYAGVVRNAKGLKLALAALEKIKTEADGDPLVANMVLTAQLIVTAALKRKESRGGHYRSDYPQASAALAHRTFITIRDLAATAGHSRRTAPASGASCSP